MTQARYSIIADLKDATSRYPADARLQRLVRDLRTELPEFAGHRSAQTAGSSDAGKFDLIRVTGTATSLAPAPS